jgi:hypothetical protein
MTDNSSEEDVDSLFVIFNNYKVAWIAELILRNYMEHCPPQIKESRKHYRQAFRH